MFGALVFAAATGIVQLSDRTDARLRLDTGQPPAYDLANTPLIAADLSERWWDIRATYGPSLLLQDLQLSPLVPQLIQTATLAGTWHERTASLSLQESATYGNESTAYLGLAPATQGTQGTPGMPMVPPLQLLPQNTRSILFGSSRTMLLADLHPTRRWQISPDVGYFVYGGLDANARQVLPLQRGPFADVNVAYALNGVDRLVTLVSASRAEFGVGPCPPTVMALQCSPDDYLGVATEGWSHVFSRSAQATVGAGASVLRARLNPSDRYLTQVYPSGNAVYELRSRFERSPVVLRLEADLAPVVDFRSGAAENRGQFVGTLSWTSARVTLQQLLGVARSLGNDLAPPAWFVLSTSTAEYRPSKYVTLSASFNYVWQDQQGTGAFSSAIAGVSVTVRTLPARF